MSERFDPTETITQMRALAPKASAEEAAMRAFMHALPLPAFVKAYGKEPALYHYANRASERIFGLRVSQIIGKTDYDLFSRSDADVARLEDQAAMDHGIAYTPLKYLPFRGGQAVRIALFRLPLTRLGGIVWVGE